MPHTSSNSKSKSLPSQIGKPLELREDFSRTTGEQHGDIQPKAGEDAAFRQAVLDGKAHVLLLTQPPPFDAGFIHEPDEVFAHTVATIGALLLMQLNGYQGILCVDRGRPGITLRAACEFVQVSGPIDQAMARVFTKLAAATSVDLESWMRSRFLSGWVLALAAWYLFYIPLHLLLEPHHQATWPHQEIQASQPNEISTSFSLTGCDSHFWLLQGITCSCPDAQPDSHPAADHEYWAWLKTGHKSVGEFLMASAGWTQVPGLALERIGTVVFQPPLLPGSYELPGSNWSRGPPHAAPYRTLCCLT